MEIYIRTKLCLTTFEYLKPLYILKWKNKFNCIAAHFKNEINFFNRKGLLVSPNCSVTGWEVLTAYLNNLTMSTFSNSKTKNQFQLTLPFL